MRVSESYSLDCSLGCAKSSRSSSELEWMKNGMGAHNLRLLGAANRKLDSYKGAHLSHDGDGDFERCVSRENNGIVGQKNCVSVSP